MRFRSSLKLLIPYCCCITIVSKLMAGVIEDSQLNLECCVDIRVLALRLQVDDICGKLVLR